MKTTKALAAVVLFGLMGVAQAAPKQTECEHWESLMNKAMDGIPAKHDAILKEKGSTSNTSPWATS